MKVLFIQSYLGANEPLVFPIGLACLLPTLADHEVRIFDTNTSENPFQEIKEIVRTFVPDVIGISLRNIDSTNKRKVVFYYQYLKDLLEVIKGDSDARIIIGGSGFSMFAREIMEDEPRVDYGVFLEGEEVLPALLANLDKPETVKSIFYRKNGTVIFTGPGKQLDLNFTAYPDRESVSLEKYKEIPDAIGIETKRGCILDCIYCIYGFLNGKTLRFRHPKKIVDEIETLVNKYQVNQFTFIDSVFNIPIEHATDICREIVARGLNVSWSAWFNESALTEEFVKLVKAAGCRNIILSPDGFSDAVLKQLAKCITKRDIVKTYNMLKNIDGFDVSYNFFKNPPGQSILTLFKIILFCIKGKLQMGNRIHYEFNSLRIEPHTKLCQLAVQDGFIKKDENLLYPKYYTNPRTRYIDKLFNIVLSAKGK